MSCETSDDDDSQPTPTVTPTPRPTSTPTIPPQDDYFPNEQGNFWVYTSYDYTTDEQSEKLVEISGVEYFNGVLCQITSESDSSYPTWEERHYFVDDGEEVLGYGVALYYGDTFVNSLIFPFPFINLQYPLYLSQTWIIFSAESILGSDISLDFPDDFDNDGIDDPIDIQIFNTAYEKEDVAVPAGIFESYALYTYTSAVVHASSLGDIPIESLDRVSWFVPFLGIVQTAEYDNDELILVTQLKNYYVDTY